MRIDAVQVAAQQVQAQADRPKARVAAAPPAAQESRYSASTQPAIVLNTPRYEVTVQYNENQVLVTKFIDQKSGEIVQQIPPEQVLKIIQSIQELLKESAQTRVLDTFR